MQMSVSSSDAPVGQGTLDRGRWRGRKPQQGNFGDWIVRHRIKLIWATLLIAAIMLFAWLIWLLRYAPARTPLIVLSSAPYSWPLPPHAWSSEDIQKFAFMDGENISLRGADQPVRSYLDVLDRIDREIVRSEQEDIRVPLIVWVSMHGIAQTDSDEIYLIPSQSSAIDSRSWVSIEQLTTKLANASPERRILLVLDCNRMQVNWNIGLMENRFSERVQQAVQQLGRNNLAVMLTAAADQQATVAPDFGGSTFGHYFRQGLAGAADRDTGNGDGSVSLIELSEFVSQHVDRWARHHRGTSQTPVLVTSQPGLDFPLALSLNPDSLTQLINSDANTRRPAPTISIQRLDKLWSKLDAFRDAELYQHEPIGWRDLEHRLLGLEQLAISGQAYRSLAERTLAAAEAQVQAIDGRLLQAARSRSIVDHCNVLSADAWRLPSGLKMHTLALSEYFAKIDRDGSIEVARQLGKFSQEPSPTLLTTTMEGLSSEVASEWESGQFLRLLERYQHPDMPWEGSESSKSGIELLLTGQSRLRTLAVPSDVDGKPSDGRVHGWVRSLIASVDRDRRLAEDLVFTRSQSPDGHRLSGLIDEVTRRRNKLHSSIATCDRAMAELPYLAHWVTDRDRNRDPDTVKNEVDDQLLPLIRNTFALSERISEQPIGTGELSVQGGSIDALSDLANSSVEQPLEKLSDLLRDEVDLLSNRSESNDPRVVGELEAALSVPLLETRQRSALRGALRDLTIRLHGSYEANNGTGAEIESPTYAESEWLQHPLLAILGIEQPSGNVIAQLMREIDQQVATESDTVQLSEQRAICAAAARRTRAGAPIWFGELERNPITQLRRRDLQSLLIWHADRALTDFWGPAGQTEAFFDLAASDYLKSAAAFSEESSTEAPIESQQLTQRLATARGNAANWLTTDPTTALQIEAGDPVTSLVSISASAVDGFAPVGVATLMVQQEDQRFNSAIIPDDAIELPQQQAQSSVTLPSAVTDGTSGLSAQTMFRGHEYRGPLVIDKLGGIVIEVDPHRYERSDVTLSSPWDGLSVAFVLDCSDSMGTPLVPGGEGPTRLDVAKTALQEMLFDLSLRGNVRASVHLFGNRLGWSTDSPVRPLTRPDFVGEIDPETSPSQDVETALPLTNLSLAAAQAVIPQIATAKPWGQSPLYLATVRALDQFGPRDSNADRHVVLITDGANYQFIPSSESGVVATSELDIVDAWSEQRVPIHILGLDLDRQDDREALDAFERIGESTGGTVQDLATSDLQAALRKLLEPGMYRLENLGGDPQPERTNELGKGIRIPDPPENSHYWLTYQGRQLVADAPDSPSPLAAEELWLSGGESLQLFVSREGDSIEAYPFDENVANWGNLVTIDSGAATQHVVRLHQPQRDDGGRVSFPVSWQRRDPGPASFEPRWRFTDRPLDVWVEVQPLVDAETAIGPAYAFFDANYEPQQPVPMINLVARDWPSQARRARVRVWCQPSSTVSAVPTLPPGNELPPTTAGRSSRLAVNAEAVSSIPLGILPGVTLQTEQREASEQHSLTRLRFILNFADSAQPVDSVKVSLPPQVDAEPMRIVRRFDAEQRLAVHSFYYDPEEMDAPSEVLVSDRAFEVDGGWQLAQEYLDVEILQPGLYSPLSAKN